MPDTESAAGIVTRLDAVRSRVGRACDLAGRSPDEVAIMAATKTQPAWAVREVALAGISLVGENRVQEVVAKASELQDLVDAGKIERHLIGPLQRNKVNQVLPQVDSIDSVADIALARALSDRCVLAGRTLDVMVQVNVSAEATKSGVVPDGAHDLALAIAALPCLRLTGFMTIGAHTDNEATVREGFSRLRQIRDDVVGSHAPGTANAGQLSMGMSGDLEWAVAEGSTIVRVGSAIFGPRANARP